VAERRLRGSAAVLWTLALLAMVAAAAWQRLSGPTRPLGGHTLVAGAEVRWRLLRSGVSGEPLLVSVNAPQGAGGSVHWRRFPTDDPFAEVAMRREGQTLAALLPTQPPAGKLEYYVTLATPGGAVRIPEGEPLVMRFKGDVPAGILVPHVVVMFLSMLVGLRAALAALLARPEARRYAWVAVVGITLGGMILGPIVQKYAFGAFWTGWPLGSDLTDNKTAAMWLAWILAVASFARWPRAEDRRPRVAVAAAALVMIAVYVVPHSLRGSQIDYGKLDAAAPHDAVSPGSESR
jgi:hypothetical protein